MPLYSLSRTATVTTSGNAAWDVGISTGTRPRVMELGLFLGAATASTYGLNRTSAVGTRTSPVAFLAEDPNDVAPSGINLLDCAIAFSVQPTLNAQDFRVIGLPATIGVGIIWTFPRGYVVAASGSLAVIDRATNSAVTPIYAVADQ